MLLITATLGNALADVIHALLQRVNIAQQALKPYLALLLPFAALQAGKCLPQFPDQLIWILQTFILPDTVKIGIPHYDLIQTLIHLFLEIQIVVIGH